MLTDPSDLEPWARIILAVAIVIVLGALVAIARGRMVARHARAARSGPPRARPPLEAVVVLSEERAACMSDHPTSRDSS